MDSSPTDKPYTLDHYKGCMILAAVGDIVGYKNDSWEFQQSSVIIHQQFNEITNNKGMANLKLDMSWKYSDDTVMHLATARSLLYQKKRDLKFWKHMAK